MNKLLLLIILLGFDACTGTQSFATLRQQYVNALGSYEGVAYAAPGETTGVSCSTLTRLAYLDTNAPASSRQVIRDAKCLSAEMRDGCEGQLTQVTHAANLAALDLSVLKPGDLVVLNALTGTDAVHTVAYLGGGEFIHADPQSQRVEKFKVAESGAWSIYPAVAVSWKELD